MPATLQLCAACRGAASCTAQRSRACHSTWQVWLEGLHTRLKTFDVFRLPYSNASREHIDGLYPRRVDFFVFGGSSFGSWSVSFLQSFLPPLHRRHLQSDEDDETQHLFFLHLVQQVSSVSLSVLPTLDADAPDTHLRLQNPCPRPTDTISKEEAGVACSIYAFLL